MSKHTASKINRSQLGKNALQPYRNIIRLLYRNQGRNQGRNQLK